MEIIKLTDIGLVRSKNQDTIYASSERTFPLFIVADGMGGHNGGEIASNDAICIIKNIFESNKKNLDTEENIMKLINDSIQLANKEIYKKSIENLEYKGMGTTVSLCFIENSYIYIGHVGDSRVYIFRDEEIIQITEDHSLVNELIRRGEITKEEAITHPKKNVITRAVGTSYDIEVDIKRIRYNKGEKLLLCTDGLFNMIAEKDILEISKRESSLLKVGNSLIDRAKKNGGFDNISLIIVKL